MKKIFTLLVSLSLALFGMQAQNNALSFDGTNDYVAVPAIANNLSTFTIEAMINPTAIPATGNAAILNTDSWTIDANGSSVHFQTNNGKIILAVNSLNSSNGWPTLNYTPILGQWQHIAITYDVPNKCVKMYLNGQLLNTFTYTSMPTAKIDAARIGSWNLSRYFNGKIDEMRIWNTVRTQSEIFNNMKIAIANPATTTGLIAYYPFNQGIAQGDNTSITSLTDASSNGFNGTFNGFALTGATSNFVAGKTNKYYVTNLSAGNGSGLSWDNGTSDLKAILDMAQSGDEVWVATGTYKPTTTTDRSISFKINNGVKVYGGFAGTETSLAQRDVKVNTTTLSGNIGADADSTDNSKLLINLKDCDATTVLSGFTITEAQASSAAIVNSPVAIAKNYKITYASFGPSEYNITGDVVATVPVNGATAITNNVSGKIALIERGTCTFKTKALNAQNAGAIGVIIYNNTTGDISAMGDDVTITTPITIPVVGISQADGAIFLSQISNNLNVTLLGNEQSFNVDMNNSKAVISYCKFYNNYSLASCLSLTNQANALIENCEFEKNRSNSIGAAVRVYDSKPTFNNCLFAYNQADKGGACYNYYAETVFNNCIFNNNKVPNSGGAIYNEASSPIFTACTFDKNIAKYAGAIYNITSSPTLSNLSFTNNIVSNAAGAISVNGGVATINNTLFDANGTNNGTIGSGGAIQLEGDVTTLVNATNCLFTNNQTLGNADDGGAAVMIYSGTLNLKNCTLAQNHSATQGGAISVYDNSCTANIENSIIWSNTSGVVGAEAIANTNGTVTISYSDVQGGFTGMGNINADPKFVNVLDVDGVDDKFSTSDDGFTIETTSPVVNGGNPTSTTPDKDIAGSLRNAILDMGAYEAPLITDIAEVVTNKIGIYPNPTSDVINLSSVEGVQSINITNLSGNTVWSGSASEFPINVTSFAKGIYLVNITSADGVKTEKVVVQ